MNVFELRDRLVDDYRNYTRSFIKIRDPRIKEFVDGHLGAEGFWPEPLLQLNPAFQPGGTIDDLVAEGVLSDQCLRIFRYRESPEDRRGSQLLLHRHQREAILKAHQSQHYVLTTGTGSGKSLAYIVPIVDRVLKTGSGRGIQAIIVYPMNALANSQHEELAKFIDAAYPQGEAPVRFARYTGQEKGEAREALRGSPPDVLLTNYMMLELMLTRREDREVVRAAQGLRFLVFDELHTYRGRQGADVAMLIRRCRHAFGNDVICVGTSATMASDGTTEDQRRAVAEVSQSLFGVDFTPEQVIGESLQRATPEIDLDDANARAGIRNAVAGNEASPGGLRTVSASSTHLVDRVDLRHSRRGRDRRTAASGAAETSGRRAWRTPERGGGTCATHRSRTRAMRGYPTRLAPQGIETPQGPVEPLPDLCLPAPPVPDPWRYGVGIA